MYTKPSMLIADSSEKSRAFLTEIFETDYYVTTAGNGNDVPGLLRDFNFSVAVIDISIPGKSALELLKEIRSDIRLSTLAVIISMPEDEVLMRESALTAGANDFITKPYSTALVFRRVNNLAERSQLRDRLSDADTLTGIPNRVGFFRHTQLLLDRNKGEEYLLVRINIERFREINEFFGPETGDRVLCLLANALKKLAADIGATFGRLVGDHFAICFKKGALTPDCLFTQSTAISVALDLNYEIILRAGIYLVKDACVPVEKMCGRANIALKSIKKSSCEPYAVFDNKMLERQAEEQALISGFSKALGNDEFVICLQPIYDSTTKEIVSSEALVRWNHPEKGIIFPSNFISLFEANGFITRLDRYVWKTVCRMQAERLHNGNKTVPISVNVSRISLFSPDICEYLSSLVKSFDIPPSLIRLEITESACVDNPALLFKKLKALSDCGFKVLIDDFGSGYSSLSNLSDTSISILKLDMSFLKALGVSPRSGALLSSIIKMAKLLGMSTIAEGVETHTQFSFLRSVGCDCIQGYYFSKPVSAEDFFNLCETAPEKRGASSETNSVLSGTPLLRNVTPEAESFFNLMGGFGVYELSENVLELVKANDAYFSTLKSSAPVHGKNLFPLIHPSDRELLLNTCADAEKRNASSSCLVRRFISDTVFLWLALRISPLGKNAVGASMFVFSITDVTAQKELELFANDIEAFDFLKAFFSEVYEYNFTSGVCKPIYASREFAVELPESCGIKTFSERICEELVHPDFKEPYLRSFELEFIKQKAAASPDGAASFSFMMRSPDGSYQLVRKVLKKTLHSSDECYVGCIFRIDRCEFSSHI